MEKVHSPLGVAPPIWIPLIFLWIISPLLNKGYHYDVMLKIHWTYSPLWLSLPLELCLCALSSNIGLFSWYASDKYILLESWEEEWPPLWVCLPLSSRQYEIHASTTNATAQPDHRSTILSMTILGPVYASNLCHTIHHETKDMSIMKIENREQDINQVHHAKHSCASIMYVNRYHPRNVSTIFQHVHLPICQSMCIHQYSNHVHLPTCQTSVISLLICLHQVP